MCVYFIEKLQDAKRPLTKHASAGLIYIGDFIGGLAACLWMFSCTLYTYASTGQIMMAWRGCASWARESPLCCCIPPESKDIRDDMSGDDDSEVDDEVEDDAQELFEDLVGGEDDIAKKKGVIKFIDISKLWDKRFLRLGILWLSHNASVFVSYVLILAWFVAQGTCMFHSILVGPPPPSTHSLALNFPAFLCKRCHWRVLQISP